MIEIKNVSDDINRLKENYKTAELDKIIKKYILLKDYVTFDKDLLKNNVSLQKAFFEINLNLLPCAEDKFRFIDQYKDVFYYWYCTDMLISRVKDCSYDFMKKYALKYIKSKKTYTRRWGYVMFIVNPLKKEENEVRKLLCLFKNDNEEPVIMAEAWLLCEFAVYHPELIYSFLKEKNLSYQITSRAISKIHDSFRIEEQWKEKFREIRSLYEKKS